MKHWLYNHSLIVILVIAVLLRIGIVLTNRSFWLDDVLGLWQDQPPFGNLGIHGPIFYYLLYHLNILTNDERALRMLPSLFGAATIIPTYHFTKVLFDTKTAIVTALLFACSMYLMEFASELRNYSTLLFFELWYIYFAFRYAKLPTLKHFTLTLLFGIISMWIDYSFVWLYIVASICIPVLLFYTQKTHRLSSILSFVIIQISIPLSYAPFWGRFFYVLDHSIEEQYRWRFKPTFESWLTILTYYTTGRASYYFFLPITYVRDALNIGIVFVVSLIAIEYINIKNRVNRFSFYFLSILFTLPLATVFFIVLFILHGNTIIADHNVMIVLLAWFMFLGYLISKKGTIGILILFVFLGLNAFMYIRYITGARIEGRQDWRSLVNTSISHISGIERIYFIGLYTQPYRYYSLKSSIYSTAEIYRADTTDEIRDGIRIFTNRPHNSCFVVNDTDRYLFKHSFSKVLRLDKLSYQEKVFTSQHLYMSCIWLNEPQPT